MPWFKFTEDFTHRIRPGLTKKYHAGRETNVTTACADAAIAAGAGRIEEKPEGMRISKVGKPFSISGNNVFIREEIPTDEGFDDGDRSQPYSA